MHPAPIYRRARTSLQSVNRQNLTRWQGLSSAWRVSSRICFRCELSLGLGVDIRSKANDPERRDQESVSALGELHG
jgi:hypothetical protein